MAMREPKAHPRLRLAAAMRAAGHPWADVAKELGITYGTALNYSAHPAWEAEFERASARYIEDFADALYRKLLTTADAQLSHEDPYVVNGALKAGLAYRAHQERLRATLRLKRLERETATEDEEAPATVLDPRMPGVDE